METSYHDSCDILYVKVFSNPRPEDVIGFAYIGLSQTIRILKNNLGVNIHGDHLHQFW